MPGRPLLLVAVFATLLACQKAIGDPCNTSYDCSYQGDRVCDVAQPSGYCTVLECDPDGCPDNALCVMFNAQSQRLRRLYCMHGCNSDGDCRQPQYHCVRPDPVACTTSGMEELPPGQHCNVISDRTPPYPGWCVQAE